MPYQRELEAALEISRRAGELALRYLAQNVAEEEKEDLSPVTMADRECERLICTLLEEQFPEDGIIGEEGARKPSRSGNRWIVDPIDGTRDFVRRIPFWSVQLALERRDEIVLGIIHLPEAKETVHAVLDSGCYWNDQPARASEISRIDKAILTVSGFPPLWTKMEADRIRRLIEECWTVRGYGGCDDIAMIARGKADIWLSGSGMEWDYAPARIIARECGARFFTLDGEDRIDGDNCVICAPGLESAVRRILAIP